MHDTRAEHCKLMATLQPGMWYTSSPSPDYQIVFLSNSACSLAAIPAYEVRQTGARSRDMPTVFTPWCLRSYNTLGCRAHLM